MKATKIFHIKDLTESQLLSIAEQLEKGAIAVFPTDTVYGIGTGALCEDSIEQIYTIKQRPATSPLQILVGTIEQAEKIALINENAKKLTSFWPGALTIILPPTKVGEILTRGFTGLGIRMPGYSYLIDLLQQMKFPLASTSANLHGQPVLTNEEAVLKTFEGKVDYILLDGNLSSIASSVVDLTKDNPFLIREAGISKKILEEKLGIILNN